MNSRVFVWFFAISSRTHLCIGVQIYVVRPGKKQLEGPVERDTVACLGEKRGEGNLMIKQLFFAVQCQCQEHENIFILNVSPPPVPWSWTLATPLLQSYNPNLLPLPPPDKGTGYSRCQWVELLVRPLCFSGFSINSIRFSYPVAKISSIRWLNIS